MPTMDSTAKTAIAGPTFAIASFLWLDISGDPLRVTSHGKNITPASTGDADLDGNTFTAFDGRALGFSSVSNTDSGSDTLTITLSGIVKDSIDITLINDIANKALWQGRTCRLWFAVYDQDGVTQQGAFVPYYTGYMTAVDLFDSPESQTIQLSVENWLAAFNQASNRSYMGQKDYDSADTSPAATIAAANASRSPGQASAGGSGGGGGGSGRGGGFRTVRQ